MTPAFHYRRRFAGNAAPWTPEVLRGDSHDPVEVNLSLHNWLVFDLDRHEGKPDGVAAFYNFASEAGIVLPTTWVTTTKSGGEHVWFSIPQGLEIHDEALLPSVEVKAKHIRSPNDAGYSLNTNGVEAPAPLPAQFVALFRKKQAERAARIAEYEKRKANPPANDLTPLFDTYNEEMDGDLPKHRSACPTGHGDAFTRSDLPGRWVCYGGGHPDDCGKQGNGCYTGDMVDLALFDLGEESTPYNRVRFIRSWAADADLEEDIIVIAQPAAAKEEPASPTPAAPSVEQKELKRNPETGAVLKTIANLLFILRTEQALLGKLGFDEFQNTPTIQFGEEPPRPQTDQDVTIIRSAIQSKFYLSWSKQDTFDCIEVVTHENTYHPLKEYLHGLTGPGAGLDSWLIEAGCPDTPWHRIAGRRWAIQAVARALTPGCKADATLLMVGAQGNRKSTLLASLCPEPAWFTDSAVEMDSKDGPQGLSGRWIVEFGELASMKKSSVERTKQFLTVQVDKYRPSYGRRVIQVPRAAVFTASTNDPESLMDDTGNRRFFPIECPNALTPLTQAKRDALWRAAVIAHQAGEQWYLTAKEEALARTAQDAHTEEHPWAAVVEEYLASYPIGGTVKIKDLFGLDCLDKPMATARGTDGKILAGILRKLGWERDKGGDRLWRKVSGEVVRKVTSVERLEKFGSSSRRYA